MNKKIIVSIIYLCLLGGTQLMAQNCCSAKQATSCNTKKSTQENAKSVFFQLKDFEKSCCVGLVEYRLKELKGFLRMEADVSKRQVQVWYDPSLVDKAMIQEAINETSYKVEKEWEDQ